MDKDFKEHLYATMYKFYHKTYFWQHINICSQVVVFGSLVGHELMILVSRKGAMFWAPGIMGSSAPYTHKHFHTHTCTQTQKYLDGFSCRFKGSDLIYYPFDQVMFRKILCTCLFTSSHPHLSSSSPSPLCLFLVSLFIRCPFFPPLRSHYSSPPVPCFFLI